jgi:hypothetical protein
MTIEHRQFGARVPAQSRPSGLLRRHSEAREILPTFLREGCYASLAARAQATAEASPFFHGTHSAELKLLGRLCPTYGNRKRHS